MTWERFASDIFETAKQSAPNERFTEKVRQSLLAWTAAEGAKELAAVRDPHAAIRRRLALEAGIPLRDSSGRKIKPKRGDDMSAKPASPFDNISQAAVIPNELQPRISVEEVNSTEPGPYYVYLPGLNAEGLKEMLHSIEYNNIPAGEIFRIGPIETGGLHGRLENVAPQRVIKVQHAIEAAKVDRYDVINIAASTTLKALQSDHAITQHVLSHLTNCDKIDIEHTVLNEMIRPFVRQRDGSLGPIKELTKPEEWRREIDAVGMLAVRLRWLEEAVEKLETLRVLEAHRRVIDGRPFLRDTWLRAIKDFLIPANDQFRIVAETRLAQIEERMRNPQNSDSYDRYSFKLMWLLGRKPERSALSRTLEAKGQGGLTAEEIKLFVATEMAKAQAQQAVASPAQQLGVQQIQCEECGEFVNSVKGGPPRKCRHCGYEFRPKDQVPAGLAVQLDERVYDGDPSPIPRDPLSSAAQNDGWQTTGASAAAELDQASPIAQAESDLVEESIETAPAPAGEGLSQDDEAEMEDLAASILRS